MRKIWKEKWLWQGLAIMFALWIAISFLTLFQMHHVGLSLDRQLVIKVFLTYLSVVTVITTLLVMINSAATRGK